MKVKKAIILSAGFGKRLHPITLNKPKPLLKINNKTLLENAIHVLEKFGIEEIIINTHYLSEQIYKFINSKKFHSKISLIDERKKILNTGGGILNAASKFDKHPYFVINSDTIWSDSYLNEFKTMEEKYFSKNYKNILLVVDKTRSFDKNLAGDFNLENNILNRNSLQKRYIYTGCQILNNSVFQERKVEPFSINLIWDFLIKKNELFGTLSNRDFFHITNLKIYNEIIRKTF